MSILPHYMRAYSVHFCGILSRADSHRAFWQHFVAISSFHSTSRPSRRLLSQMSFGHIRRAAPPASSQCGCSPFPSRRSSALRCLRRVRSTSPLRSVSSALLRALSIVIGYYPIFFVEKSIFICTFQKKVVPLHPQRFKRYYDSFIT